ncbi:MAG: NADP-dependent oxidoreductase, partial [Candidatus Dormibacteraeota bacterium]|nr:NADP-dependent oxidoreductase [Candidatus Dormibacteraeota bacterium]
VVEAVAPGVTRFRPGDQVFGMPNFPRPAGAYAEYVTAPARHLARKPAGLDHVHAAALPVAGLTAWQTLVDTAGVGPGRRVLIRAAAGGVGHLAVQVAKLRGAYVLASSAPDRLEFLRSLGADEAIDDRREDFLTLVGEVDVVLDLVVDEESVVTSQEVLCAGGLLIAIGELEYPQVPNATTMLVEPDYAELENLAGLVDEGRLRVEVEAVFPLEEAAAAHEAGERGGRRGKLVLEVG